VTEEAFDVLRMMINCFTVVVGVITNMHKVEEIQCLRCCRPGKNYGTALMMCISVRTKNNEHDTKILTVT
jgi:hypothetical protein